MTFGFFALTGSIPSLGGSPAVGEVVVTGNPSTIVDPVGNRTWVSPQRVSLVNGEFSISLPTDVSTGVSSAVGYRVSFNLRDLTDPADAVFPAQAVGSTLDVADIVTAVFEPIGDTAANKIAAASSASAAAASAAAAAAVGTTNDTLIAGRVNATGSATQAALDARYAPASAGGGGSAMAAQVSQLMATTLTIEESPIVAQIGNAVVSGSMVLDTGASHSTTLFTAPFAGTLLSADYVRDRFTDASADGSNNLIVRLGRKTPGGTTSTIVSKSNQDELITAGKNWSFDNSSWSAAAFSKGDTLYVSHVPSGSHQAHYPIVVTFRYAPS